MIQVSLKPSILLFLTQIMAKLRWEEGSYIPLPRVRINLGMLILSACSGLIDSVTILEDGAPDLRQSGRHEEEQNRIKGED